MKRLYRVRDNKRFQEIRRSGRSYTNELLVLCALPNCLPYSRFGFSVSSRIGNAVTRNRIKRRLREAVRLRMSRIAVGWDIVFIARNPIRGADFHAMESACARLLRRAHLLLESPVPDAPDTTGDGLTQLVVKSEQQKPALPTTRDNELPPTSKRRRTVDQPARPIAPALLENRETGTSCAS